jgi:hypothetical protein
MMMFLKLDANRQKKKKKTLNDLENKITIMHYHNLIMQTNTQKNKNTKKRRTHHVLESWCRKIEIKNALPYIIILNACTKIQNTNACVHGLQFYIDLHSLIYGTFSNLFI